MAILKNLLKGAKRASGIGGKPLPKKIRTVNPPGERKSRIDTEPPPKMPGDSSVPDYGADALSLESDAAPEDNPYGTHSWEMDPEADTRRLKTLAIDPTTGKPEDSANPYESGKRHRGWKE